MRSRILDLTCAAVTALLLSAGTSFAADTPGQKIAKGSDCFSCHAVDQKIVGPSFNDVAKKFAGQASAQNTLVDAVLKGHVGTWGTMAMPPHPNLTKAQVGTIVSWILSLKSSAAAPAAAAATPAKIYTYKVAGKPVTTTFPIYVGNTKKVTLSIFHGYEQYNSYCFRCHGEDVTGSEYAPDLKRSVGDGGMDHDKFVSTAMTGRKEKGMPSWAGFFTPQQIDEIYQYVKARSVGVVGTGVPKQ